jgi:hypothetical protein
MQKFKLKGGRTLKTLFMELATVLQKIFHCFKTENAISAINSNRYLSSIFADNSRIPLLEGFDK